MEGSLIEIKKYVLPDLTIIESVEQYDKKYEYFKYSFAFSESIVLIEDCDEEGNTKYSYREKTYRACKLDGDDVYIVDPKIGWIKHVLASAHWHDKIAEREILGESTSTDNR